MISLNLVVNTKNWNKKDDILDLTGYLKVKINDADLPEDQFPNGFKIRIYETVFEFLDLLNNTIKAVSGKKEAEEMPYIFQAEFCYTGNFLDAMPIEKNRIKLIIRFNPATVDEKFLLKADKFSTETTIQELATEIIALAITAYDSFVEFDPDLEKRLDIMQQTICDSQELLEKEFKIQLFPPPDANE